MTVTQNFHFGLKVGCHQMRGRVSGPMLRSMIARKPFPKYHGIEMPEPDDTGMGGGVELILSFRNSPQYLHLIASSWISSAQKGQVFINLG